VRALQLFCKAALQKQKADQKKNGKK